MKKLFSLGWGKPKQESAAGEESEPMDAESVALIEGYAERILATLRKGEPTATYDSNSVRRLGADLTANGARYTPDQRVKIANMYGAFLGRAILVTYPQFQGKWVRWRGDVGIEFAHRDAGRRKILFPITKAFKHIENGEPDSIHALFSAVPEFVQSNPAA